MLKILRPFWNTASLVYYDAPVKKGYRNNTFLMNSNNRNDGHQIEWNARFTEQINTCDVLFRGGGKKNLMFFFPARKAVDVWWKVYDPHKKNPSSHWNWCQIFVRGWIFFVPYYYHTIPCFNFALSSSISLPPSPIHYFEIVVRRHQCLSPLLH